MSQTRDLSWKLLTFEVNSHLVPRLSTSDQKWHGFQQYEENNAALQIGYKHFFSGVMTSDETLGCKNQRGDHKVQEGNTNTILICIQKSGGIIMTIVFWDHKELCHWSSCHKSLQILMKPMQPQWRPWITSNTHTENLIRGVLFHNNAFIPKVYRPKSDMTSSHPED